MPWQANDRSGETVRVLFVSTGVGGAEKFHDHPHPSVFISYGALPLKVSDNNRTRHISSLNLDGTGAFASVQLLPPEALHSIRNLGPTATRNIRIEFKKGFPTS